MVLNRPIAGPITMRGRDQIRGTDAKGSGDFMAARKRVRVYDHETKVISALHEGLDLLANRGEGIFAPIDGDVTLSGTTFFIGKGLKIKGSGAWEGYEVKILYIDPFVSSGSVRAGDVVGVVIDISKNPEYKGASNHVHVEVRRDGYPIDPREIYRPLILA